MTCRERGERSEPHLRARWYFLSVPSFTVPTDGCLLSAGHYAECGGRRENEPEVRFHLPGRKTACER